MRIVLAILLISCSFSAHSSRLSKAFDALEIYNYFEAKRLFEKSLKKHPVPANFGLSIIYARKDNPFSNLDSAFFKIKKSFLMYSSTKEKWKKKYLKVGVDSVKIIDQRDLVSSLYFARAKEVNSIYGFQDFADKCYWSLDVDSALYYRDELAFEKAVNAGGSADFSYFLAAYPQSHFAGEAQKNLDKSIYVEQTYSNSFIDYVNFVNNNPNSPYREEAEDKIYAIATETGTAESYKGFIVEHPSNRNVNEAWKFLYNTVLTDDYSAENILNFKKDYPEYPFSSELQIEYNVADKVFYPIRSNNKWGYCDKFGTVQIDPKFESAEWFSEGMAIVVVNEKYGFINKIGKLVIPAQFDDAMPFTEGHALVEQGEKWGMIDRNGVFVIQPEYEDLGALSNGLCYFEEDDLYGYFDAKGNKRLKAQYTEAFDFEGDYAVVSKNEYYGVIDEFGTTFIPFKFDDIFYHSEDRFVAELNEYYGLINTKKDTIISFEYDYIGKPYDGISIVEMDGEFNFARKDGSFIMENWMETYPEYRVLARFKNGYAKIKSERGYNLVDSTGKKLFAQDQLDVGAYSDVIAVKKGENWGYVNKKNQKILGFDYTYAKSFESGSAIVEQSPFYGVIDKQGNFLVNPLQEYLQAFNDTILIAKSLGKFGLITIEGDTLLPYKYSKIEPIDEKVVQLEEEGDVFYYNCQLKQFIRKEE